MKKAGHTHTHAPNAVIHSDQRTKQSSVVHPLQGAGRNPRERGRSLMPSNNLIRTFCGQEDERSTNRRRRKTHKQREAPRQRAGIRKSGTLMGDITPPHQQPSQTQIPKKPHISHTDNRYPYLRASRHTTGLHVGIVGTPAPPPQPLPPLPLAEMKRH